MSDKWWVDPSFDPMEDLHQAKMTILQLQHNERVLLGAINEQSQMLKDLSLQHRDVTAILNRQSREIVKMRQTIQELTQKQQAFSPSQ